ncbi:ABC transporter substrate-binding protein [Pseudonocardiaceae bacterium YIM PH 21723]|nr:ABC transporter substrate-binding protein [Pseudonocardiaceae bacterium YIM PH 21723]
MRRALTALIAVCLVAGLTACRDENVGADGRLTIMVGGVDKVIYLPAMLSQRLGYFADEGLDVKLLSESSGATAENALVAGDVQGVVGFYDHTVDLQSKGKCITSVVQFANIPGEVEVVATDKADTIKGPQDFRGKKLGYTSPGSSTDFLTRYLAVKGGLSTRDYTGVKAGAGGTFIAAIDNHAIDAGMTTDPTVAQLVSSGKGKVLLDMRTEEGTRAALGGLYPASSLYTDCAWAARHKPIVQKLANALVRTLRFINEHSAEEIAGKMPHQYAKMGNDLYIKAIHDSKTMFNTDGRMDADGARMVLDVLSQFSPTVKAKKDGIDLSKTYTTEFADQAGTKP